MSVPSRRDAVLRLTAVGVTALALAFLVGRVGSPGWRAVRVAEVVLMAALGAAVLVGLGRRWRGLALLLGGIVGSAAGIGISVQWIPKGGSALVVAAGVLALLGGLACLALGLVDLGGSVAGPLRWALGLALFLCSAVLLLALSIAVAVTNVPATALDSATPADRGLAFEEASFATRDGVTLTGWYVPSANESAVVLLHGSGSNRSAVLDHAVVLARAGYGVLLFDARGHGESGGRAMDFGWFGDRDVAAALDYLEQRAEVDPARLAAVGLSMGGEEAIGAAAADSRLQVVVAEGASGRTADDKAWIADAYGFRGWVQQRVDDLTYWFTDLLAPTGPPISLRDAAATMAPRPLLLITAGQVEDEQRAAEYIRSEAPSSVRVWEVPGAAHTGGLAAAPAEWEERVLGFLDLALAGGAG